MNKNEPIKQWVPQAERTAKSEKKLSEGLDKLKSRVTRYPGEKVHRTDVPGRVLQLIECRGEGRTTRDNFHKAVKFFNTVALKYEVGQKVDLESTWTEFLSILAGIDPGWAHEWNTNEHRNAFFWQIAGHVASDSSPLPRYVLENRRTLSADGVWGYQTKNKFIPHPKQHVPHPTFLAPGATWDSKEIFAYTVQNMRCNMELFAEGLKVISQ